MFGECKLEIFMVLCSGHSIQKTANGVRSAFCHRGIPQPYFAYSSLPLNMLMRKYYVRNRKHYALMTRHSFALLQIFIPIPPVAARL